MASVLLVGFWAVSSCLVVLSAVIFTYCAKVSQSFEDLLLFGKLRAEQRKWSVVQLIEVPKRWFIHFYAVGSIINSAMFALVVFSYIASSALPVGIQILLGILNCGSEPLAATTDALSCVLLIGLMAIQNIRRLLECLYVSVYSPRCTMNVMHYLFGILLYSSFSFAILCESPDPADFGSASLLSMLSWRHIAGMLLFVWASWHHHQAHVTFARLRTSKKGKVVSYEHAIPRGGWFEYVSCPHYFMEILIYVAFQLIGGPWHITLLSILVFVITNQLVSGCITHRWYCGHFGALYPVYRKAIIPFVL